MKGNDRKEQELNHQLLGPRLIQCAKTKKDHKRATHTAARGCKEICKEMKAQTTERNVGCRREAKGNQT